MNFIGSVVSLGCGDALGTYQGKVIKVDNAAQTVTIEKPFRNGKQCMVPFVTINAIDIAELKILKTPKEADTLPEVRHKDVSVTTMEDFTPTHPAPKYQPPCNTTTVLSASKQKDSHCSAASTPHKSSRQNGKQSPRYDTGKSQRQSPSYYSKTPVKNSDYVSGQSQHNGVLNDCGNSGKNYRQNIENGRNHQRPSPTKVEEMSTVRPRKSSFSDNQTVTVVKRGYSTPRKTESRKKTSQEDCFSAPVDTFISEDFDFEKNLALFDKQAVFEEIESFGYPKVVNCAPQLQEAKYKSDENVLHGKPAVYEQIMVPGSKGKQFVTDAGLVVPCVSYEVRGKLLELAHEAGYSIGRQIETVGRSAAEMVLQLIGGSHRLVPQNAHQRASVVVLCGPHIQGAEGVNCAQHLAAHNIQVTLYMPNFVRVLSELEVELKLFDLFDGMRTASIKDLPSLPVDIIVNAMDNHDNKCLREQSWYQKVVDWANQSKAPVLGIDPPLEGSAIELKWSMGVGLPLALSDQCGQVYLSDLSLPSKLYKSLGIKYMSPFAHKFVIPLHKS